MEIEPKKRRPEKEKKEKKKERRKGKRVFLRKRERMEIEKRIFLRLHSTTASSTLPTIRMVARSASPLSWASSVY